LHTDKVTVIGAGYMGSAITFPLIDAGFEVNLWGTWLDDKIIHFCRKGLHPKLKKPLPEAVKLWAHQELQSAIEGSKFIFLAVTSQGFMPVFLKILNCAVPRDACFLCLTKGLIEQENRVERISAAATSIYRQKTKKNIAWASIGGPVKAVELAYFTPTLSVYATRDSSLAAVLEIFKAGYYRLNITSDVCGVEICSAFKNIYAMGLGICDGLYSVSKPGSYHNFSSILFSQAVREMNLITEAVGGKSLTAYGPAGVGDLYVTSQSGRNRRFGELIGKGLKAQSAYEDMLQQGEVAEGYHALKLGHRYVLDLGLIERLPLLESLYEIAYKSKDPEKVLVNWVESC